MQWQSVCHAKTKTNLAFIATFDTLVNLRLRLRFRHVLMLDSRRTLHGGIS